MSYCVDSARSTVEEAGVKFGHVAPDIILEAVGLGGVGCAVMGTDRVVVWIDIELWWFAAWVFWVLND
jgi:hypothetical protein